MGDHDFKPFLFVKKKFMCLIFVIPGSDKKIHAEFITYYGISYLAMALI